MGDDWTYLCTVADQRIDPLEALGIIPDRPLAYWGWGEIADQYGRRSENRRRRDPAATRPAAHRPTTAAPVVGKTMIARAAVASVDARS
jgi:hypothetical protein